MSFKSLVLACCVYGLSISTAFSQVELFGVTSGGGSSGKGVIFSYKTSYKVLYNFSVVNRGALPRTKLLEAANGKLYGVTSAGGINDGGVLFEYDPTTKIYTVLYDFGSMGGTQPWYPNRELMQAASGKLYGTSWGGPKGDLLFEFDIAQKKLTDVFDFAFENGSPTGALCETPSHTLLFVTNRVATKRNATLSEFDPVTKTLTVRYDFGANNMVTASGLIPTADGKFMGTVFRGSNSETTAVYEYDPASNGLTIKYASENGNWEFKNIDNLTAHPNGKFYGTSTKGGALAMGNIYEFDPATNAVKIKVSDFYVPNSPLLLATNGKMYGLGVGSPYQFGSLYEFDPLAGQVTKSVAVSSVSAGLIQASNGRLYGANYEAGAAYKGTVYSYELGASAAQTEFSFEKSLDGNYPVGHLTQAYNGKFYGVTIAGGGPPAGYTGVDVKNGGVIYEFDPATKKYTKKFDFKAHNYPSAEDYPVGGFTLHPNGKLYLMAEDGPDDGYILEFDPVTGTITNEASLGAFYDNTTGGLGKTPVGSLALAPNGKMYGLVGAGGIHQLGTLIEYDPTTHKMVKKFDFSQTTGGNPTGGLTLHPNGKFYGVLLDWGVNNNGTLFEYDYVNNVVTKKVDGGRQNFSNPTGTLVVGRNGNLFGTSKYGPYPGTLGYVFEYVMATGKLVIYNGLEGNPVNDLLAMPNGTLYGLTQTGGTNPPMGTLFKWDAPQEATVLSVIHSFATATGVRPFYTGLTVVKKTQNVSLTTASITKAYGDGPLSLTASATSSLPLYYRSTNPEIAEVVNGNLTFKGVGTATIIVGQLGNVEYLPAAEKQIAVTVSKANLTVKAPVVSKKYGEALPEITLTYVGFVGTETAASIDVPPSYTLTAGPLSPVGDYPITLKGGADNNYNFLLENGTLSVSKANLTIAAANQTRKYKQPNPTLTLEYVGFVGNDDATVLETIPTLNCAATIDSHPGTFPIVVSGGADDNYDLVLNNGQLTVQKALLKVKANSFSRPYKQPNPTFTLSYDGFAGTDQSSNLAETPSLTCLATQDSDADAYPIVLSGGSDDDYELVFENGTLTVTSIDQTITFGSLNKVYVGDSPFDLAATSTSGLPVLFKSDHTAIATIAGNRVTIVSPGEANIIAYQPGNKNYTAAPEVIQPLQVGTITGVEDPAQSKLRIYPTPTSGLLYVEGGVNQGAVRITNLLGEVVAEPQRNMEGQIDISALPPGYYFLQYASAFYRIQKL
ncbi:choice-of-anchor tandem repeat GloVer-containing protein [Chryseolinea soli]|uniref:T9SS C-terminal target domain-containing protein n=1 Tax=Chryseolinea soli TaxID=2321403 RepID=A0A385SRA8_9BACT|nr:choice-of-anchor tandem repeat GloVer-containing protein [Chryseolinea soli]AYB32495.1 T9SS C-terminal target domain-containing protein [Chryseolinea soli]